MESPIKGDKEEWAHTAGRGLPAAGTPPTRGEAVQRGRGAPAGSRAEEDYPAAAEPRWVGKGIQDRLSLAPPLPRAPDSEAATEGEGAQWSPGRAAEVAQGATRRTKSGRDRVRMARRRAGVVGIAALVARMDLGGMGCW